MFDSNSFTIFSHLCKVLNCLPLLLWIYHNLTVIPYILWFSHFLIKTPINSLKLCMKYFFTIPVGESVKDKELSLKLDRPAFFTNRSKVLNLISLNIVQISTFYCKQLIFSINAVKVNDIWVEVKATEQNIIILQDLCI